MALVFPPYITQAQFENILSNLDIQESNEAKLQDLLDRAVGQLEGKLVPRFVVPLVATNGGPFAMAPQFSRNLVLNALKATIRRLIGLDHNRNLVVDGTQRFIDVHKMEQKEVFEDLLNPNALLGFKLQPHAEGSIGPVQAVGLARADNEVRLVDDPWV